MRTYQSLGADITCFAASFVNFMLGDGWDCSVWDFYNSSAAEKEPRYEPFTDRTPLVCDNHYIWGNGIGSICNPCGVWCEGNVALKSAMAPNLKNAQIGLKLGLWGHFGAKRRFPKKNLTLDL